VYGWGERRDFLLGAEHHNKEDSGTRGIHRKRTGGGQVWRQCLMRGMKELALSSEKESEGSKNIYFFSF
jgi:hypothetical protein